MPTLNDDLLNSPEVDEVVTPEGEPMTEVPLMGKPQDLSFESPIIAAEEAAPPDEMASFRDEYRPPLIDLEDTAEKLDVNSPRLQAQRDLETLDAICLYEYDQDFRKKVDNHERYSTYKNPYLRHGKDADYEIGKDWLDAMERAGYADKGMSKMPREAARAMVASMQDRDERVKWQIELQKQDIKDKTSAVDYYEIIGKIHRQDLERRYKAEDDAYNAQQMEQHTVKMYNEELQNYIVNADSYEDVSPGLRQFLRDTGSEKKLDTVHNAMARFNWRESGGQERARYLGSMMEAYWDLKDDPEARRMFMQTIAQRAYDSTKEGKTNFVRGVGEGLIRGISDAGNWLLGLKFGQGGEAFDALAEALPGDAGKRILAGYRMFLNQLGGDSPDEAAQNAQATSEFNRDFTAFIGEFDAAVEQGRQLAEQEDGSMGFWRQSGTLVGEILPAFIGGAGAGAAKLAPEAGLFLARASAAEKVGSIGYGLVANSVFAASAEESEFARMLAEGKELNEDSTKAARAAGLGNLAAFSVGMPLVNKGISFALPGMAVAGEKIGGAIAKSVDAIGSKTVAQGVELAGLGAQRVMNSTIAQVFNKGVKYLEVPTVGGVVARLGVNTVTNAANFGLLIPTVTAAVAGVTEEMMDVNPEYRTAYQRYVESMKQLRDLDHDKMLLGQSMLLAAMHAPSEVAKTMEQRKKAKDAIEGFKREYEKMGGDAQDVDSAAAKYGAWNVGEVVKACNGTLSEKYKADPVGMFNKAADNTEIEINRTQALRSLEDNIMRHALIKNEGVYAEGLEDGKVRIYTDAKFDKDGKVEKGEKYQDVDRDIAERFLGRLGKGAYERIANNIADFVAGRITTKGFKGKVEESGAAFLEDIFSKEKGMEDIEKDAMEAEKIRLGKALELAGAERVEDITEEQLRSAGNTIEPRLSSHLTLNDLITVRDEFARRLNTEEGRGGKDNKTAGFVVETVRNGQKTHIYSHSPRHSFLGVYEEAGEFNLLNILSGRAVDTFTKLKQASGREEDVAYPLVEAAKDLLAMRTWMAFEEKYKAVSEKWLGISSDVERKINEGSELTDAEMDQLRHDVVEGFSMLFRSGIVSDALTGEGSIPEWMRGPITSCIEASENSDALKNDFNTLGAALSEMEQTVSETPESAERFEKVITELVKNNREMFEQFFRGNREAPTPEEIAAYENELRQAQEEVDKKFGKGVSTAVPVTEEQVRQWNEAHAQRDAQNEADEAVRQEEHQEKINDVKAVPGNENMSDEEASREIAENAAKAKQNEMAAKQAAGDDTIKNDDEAVFEGGKYISIKSAQFGSEGFGDVKLGLVPVDKIGFAPEVPQFKMGASEEGVVHPLKGFYRPDHDPIRIWQRKDGRLHVISGRHRLAYAKQAGASSIMAFVYKENDVRNAQWARTLDMEQNIRDNMASELEIALYVRGENAHGRQLSEEEIDAAGIDRKGSIGEMGVLLGRFAADEVLAALQNELKENFVVADAIRIVQFAPGDKDVQVEGLRAMVGEDAVGIQTARRIMERFLEVKRRSEGMGIEEGEDLLGLGLGTSLMDNKFNRFYGEYQDAKLKQLTKDKAYVNALLSNTTKVSPKVLEAAQKRVGKRLGLDKGEKMSLQELKKEIEALYQKWKSPSAHKELMDEMEAAFREKYEGADWMQPKVEQAEQKQAEKVEQPKAELALVYFSLGGERAATFGEMQANGLTYLDEADGKMKFMLPTGNIRFNTGFTSADLHSKNADVVLSSLMSYPELYRAYPELKNLRVHLYHDQDERVGGFYAWEGIVDNEGAFIAVNVKSGTSEKRILSTLLHESQHAIQRHEGWATGASLMTHAQALEYLDKAIAQRKELGTKTEWAKANLKYLEGMRKKIEELDGDSSEFSDYAYEVYRMAHGEQEARYAGSRSIENDNWVPRIVSSNAETIAVRPDDITSLGGITFGNAGIYSDLMQSRLAPVGDFHMDKRMMDIRKSAVRLASLLKGFTVDKDKTGQDLLLEAQGVAERAVSLLPNDYRFAMEPYRVWLSVFSRLSVGDEKAGEKAAGMVPMTGWPERMSRSFLSQIGRVLQGEIPIEELEFWVGNEGSRKVLDEARATYEKAYAKAQSEKPKAKPSTLRKRAYEIIKNQDGFEELKGKIYSELGKVKTEKVLAKLLDRVKLQLDAYRKDRTLEAIRKEVAKLYPKAKESGAPTKGKANAETYNTLATYMDLLNLTKGQVKEFEETQYTGSNQTAWQEMDPLTDITVKTFDDVTHEEKTIHCTKLEYDTYACFDAMTAEQAEVAARNIGELITTGKKAWENAQDAASREIAAFCAPLIASFDRSENARREAALKDMGITPSTRWIANLFSGWFNSAQAWDIVAHDNLLGEFGRFVGKNVERAEVNLQVWAKQRYERVYDMLQGGLGINSERQFRAFIDDMNMNRDSGIRLVEQEPDFLQNATNELRQQFLNLLNTKTHLKSFVDVNYKNLFAAALDYLTSPEYMQKEIRDEVLAKYGSLGDASKAKASGEAAVGKVLSEDEQAKFVNLIQEAKIRADDAREKWLAEREEKAKKLEADGITVQEKDQTETLELSKGEAAYRVLLCEQDDYAEMMRRQGYTDEVVQQLRDFAGKDVMKLAYMLRDDLSDRTPQIKALYEKLYGLPFPEVENYFRAFFEVGHQTEARLISDGDRGNRSGGGKIAVLYTRHRHNSKVEPTMNVLSAYFTVQQEQDVLLAYRDLPNVIQRVLNYKVGDVEMRKAMERKFGRGFVGSLQKHAENMQRAVSEVEQVGNDMTRIVSALGGAFAKGILNGKISSLTKQFTAFFNTLAGSDRVSWWEWQKSQSRVLAGLGVMSYEEMKNQPELSSRWRGIKAIGRNEALHAQTTDVTGYGATGSGRQAGMGWMEGLDVWNNVKSCQILYDAVYRQLLKENKQNPENQKMTPQEMHEIAMGEVRHSLAMKSQPMGWRTRSLMATKRTVLSIGNFFLGGESMNTFANVARLLAEDRYGRAAQVWLTHGMALQALTLAYNFLTDDEEQWKKRNASQYLSGVLLGPFMGVPIVSQALSNFMPWQWAPQQSLLPGADLKREINKIKSAFFGKKKTSVLDKSIAVNDCIRTLGTFAIMGTPSTPAHAKTKGAAYIVTFASNLIDFLLRLGRAADERL